MSKWHTDWKITDNAIEHCVAIEDEQGPFAYVECEVQELAHQIIVEHECCAGADNPAPGELARLRDEIAEHETYRAVLHRRWVPVQDLYKRVHGMPVNKFPDMGEVIEWTLSAYENIIDRIQKEMLKPEVADNYWLGKKEMGKEILAILFGTHVDDVCAALKEVDGE